MMNFFPILTLILIGLVITYEDIKLGRIRNQWILLGIIAAILFYCLSFIKNPLSINWEEVISNILISFYICIFLWKYRYWTAADAKLFLIFVLLIPLEYYQGSYLKYFPSFNLFINTFVPAFIIIFIRAITTATKLVINKRFEIGGDFKKNITSKWKEHFQVILGFIVIFLLFIPLRRISKSILPIEESVFIIILFFLYRPLYSFFKKKEGLKIILLILFVYLLYIVTSPTQLFNEIINCIKNAVLFIIIVSIITKIINFYSETMEVIKIKVADLKPGDVITDKYTEILRNKNIEAQFYPDGLTSQEVKMLKETLPKDEETDIYATIPFAPIILCGGIITLILKQSILHFIFKLITS